MTDWDDGTWIALISNVFVQAKQRKAERERRKQKGELEAALAAVWLVMGKKRELHRGLMMCRN